MGFPRSIESQRPASPPIPSKRSLRRQSSMYISIADTPAGASVEFPIVPVELNFTHEPVPIVGKRRHKWDHASVEDLAKELLIVRMKITAKQLPLPGDQIPECVIHLFECMAKIKELTIERYNDFSTLQDLMLLAGQFDRRLGLKPLRLNMRTTVDCITMPDMILDELRRLFKHPSFPRAIEHLAIYIASLPPFVMQDLRQCLFLVRKSVRKLDIVVSDSDNCGSNAESVRNALIPATRVELVIESVTIKGPLAFIYNFSQHFYFPCTDNLSLEFSTPHLRQVQFVEHLFPNLHLAFPYIPQIQIAFRSVRDLFAERYFVETCSILLKREKFQLEVTPLVTLNKLVLSQDTPIQFIHWLVPMLVYTAQELAIKWGQDVDGNETRQLIDRTRKLQSIHTDKIMLMHKRVPIVVIQRGS